MKLHINYFFLATIVGLYACEKELDYKDLNFQPQIVMNSLVYNDSIIRINISRTKSILEADSILPFLENAEVKLFENGDYVEKLKYDDYGDYYSSIKTKSNATYRMEASTNEIPTATASIHFSAPEDVKLENVNWNIKDTTISIDKPVVTDTNLTKVTLYFDLFFNDNPNEDNHYTVNCNGLFKQVAHQTNFASDGNRIMSTYVTNANSCWLQFLDRAAWERFFVSEGSWYNGYGSFSHITDASFNGQPIRFQLKTQYYVNVLDTIDVVLYSYPEEYFYFQKTGLRYLTSTDNPYSQPINVYTNVENGLGFVCAISSSKQKLFPSK